MALNAQNAAPLSYFEKVMKKLHPDGSHSPRRLTNGAKPLVHVKAPPSLLLYVTNQNTRRHFDNSFSHAPYLAFPDKSVIL